MATMEMPYLKNVDLKSKQVNVLKSLTRMKKRIGGIRKDYSRHCLDT